MKFFPVSKKNKMKESPYYIGYNTTTKRAVTSPSAFGQDVIEITDAFDNGCHLSEIQADEEEDAVPELKQFPATPQSTVAEINLNTPRTSSAVSSNSTTGTPKSTVNQTDSIFSAPRRTVSMESFETLFKPKEEYYALNQRVTSCAMSTTRNPLIISGVAAAFYNGGWLASTEQSSQRDVAKLNEFLTEVRADLHSGLPGRLLTVVINSQLSDLGSVVSTISYAYFLHISRQSDDQCFLPVINMKRSDLQLHTEVFWLLKTVQLDINSLFFIDEITLSYYHRFGNLRLVLVNHNQLDPVNENFKDEVVEILDPEMFGENEGYDIDKAGSCCTLVAEKFASEAPDVLMGRGLSRLLLAGILLDTSNLDLTIGQCFPRDVCMATLLLNGAGRYGRNGFFKILRKKVSDLSVLSPKEILNKGFRYRTPKTGRTGQEIRVGLSSMGISLSRFLTVETGVSDEISYLRRSHNLDFLLVVTGYYDKTEKLKRELLISTEREGLIHALVEFYNSETVQLQPLSIIGMGPGTKAFAQGNVAISHARIYQLTESFIKQC